MECMFLDVEPASIGDTDNLMEVHNVDSVNLFEIVVALEDDYGISFESGNLEV